MTQGELDPLVRVAITDLVSARAESPDLSHLFWLHEPGGAETQEDYCSECAPIISAFGTLAFCHLALLNGDTIPPGVHSFTEEDGSHSGRCVICDIWEENSDQASCWDAPRRAMKWAESAVDGGWTSESDSWRTCENCGKDLRVFLTDYAVDTEIDHWKENGPPDCGREWWELSEVLDRLTDGSEHWHTIRALLESWGHAVEVAA